MHPHRRDHQSRTSDIRIGLLRVIRRVAMVGTACQLPMARSVSKYTNILQPWKNEKLTGEIRKKCGKNEARTLASYFQSDSLQHRTGIFFNLEIHWDFSILLMNVEERKNHPWKYFQTHILWFFFPKFETGWFSSRLLYLISHYIPGHDEKSRMLR